MRSAFGQIKDTLGHVVGELLQNVRLVLDTLTLSVGARLSKQYV
jgi:hypothetical protein